MSDLLFIGDEISAAGFRLAGLNVLVPESGEECHVFDKLNDDIDFIIITAQVAAFVPQHRMNELILVDKPLLLIITDMRDHLLVEDLSVTLRSQLGLAE